MLLSPPALSSSMGVPSNTFCSQPSFVKYLSRKYYLLHGGSKSHMLQFIKLYETAGSGINLEKDKYISLFSVRKWAHLAEAVATSEPKLLVASPHQICGIDMSFCNDSNYQGMPSSDHESDDFDEREKLRRMRISKANKGNVPWNKGRKHTPETIQRIREKTRIAMQNPKVKMKLAKLGHAQSKDTKMKIGIGVKEGWERRRAMLMVQEGCLFEWQEAVAEAARNGFAGGIELQWDSYETMNGQLMEEWVESVVRRKTMPRPAGSRRAPKSADQRKKISEAIAAKWADPEYRERVYAGLSKYHGSSVGTKEKPRPKTRSNTTVAKDPSKKHAEARGTKLESKVTKLVSPKKKRSSTPSYRDPLASAKLEMIKKIKGERAALEEQKRDAGQATERAKLLIAEAEKAAKALEMAASQNPLAQTALLQTRKLISEALRTIQVLEGDQFAKGESSDVSADDGDESSTLSSTPALNCTGILDSRGPVNGVHLLSSSNNGSSYSVPSHSSDPVSTLHNDIHSNTSYVVDFEPSRAQPAANSIGDGSNTVNGWTKHGPELDLRESKLIPAITYDEVAANATTAKMRWVRGRLVKVED